MNAEPIHEWPDPFMNGPTHSEQVFPFMGVSLLVSAIPNAAAIPNRKTYSECKNLFGIGESRPPSSDPIHE
jgi:hypothetical protein